MHQIEHRPVGKYPGGGGPAAALAKAKPEAGDQLGEMDRRSEGVVGTEVKGVCRGLRVGCRHDDHERRSLPPAGHRVRHDRLQCGTGGGSGHQERIRRSRTAATETAVVLHGTEALAHQRALEALGPGGRVAEQENAVSHVAGRSWDDR